MYSHVTTLTFTVTYEKIELLKGHLLSFVVSYHLFVFFNNANTVSAEMWVWGFGNHKWYKSLKSRVKDEWLDKTFVSHCKPIPLMKTGFSLCSISIREKPVFITGIPANENRFFPRNIINFEIHQNLFKYWFTLWHFAMDDPVEVERCGTEVYRQKL